MDNLLIASVLTASIIIVLIKTGHFRKLLAYQAPIDILVTVAIGALFAGAAGGLNAMKIAVLGGFIFSIVLYLIARTTPSEQLRRVALPNGRTRLRWVVVPAPGLFSRRNPV